MGLKPLNSPKILELQKTSQWENSIGLNNLFKITLKIMCVLSPVIGGLCHLGATAVTPRVAALGLGAQGKKNTSLKDLAV